MIRRRNFLHYGYNLTVGSTRLDSNTKLKKSRYRPSVTAPYKLVLAHAWESDPLSVFLLWRISWNELRSL